MDNFFTSYFRDTDCAIVDGRLHILSPGQDDFIQFHGRKMGLCIGPKLNVLESNWMATNKEDILLRIKQKIPKISGNTLDNSLGGDKLLMHILHDTIEHHSLKHLLGYKIDCAKSVAEQGLDPAGVINDVYKSLESDFLQDIFHEDALIIGGDMYCLSETETPKRNFAKIGRKFYQLKDRSGTTIQDMLDRRTALFEADIEAKTQANTDMARLLGQSIDKYAEKLLSSDDYYNHENNMGFHRHDDDLYVYTKTPSYVLYEKVLKKYYEFPPARLGVKVRLDSNYISIYTPVTLDSYLHPAVSSEAPYSMVCFEHVRIPNFESYSTRDKILVYLYNGCQMLMTLYCSEKGAFHNLYDPDVAKEFKDLQISVGQLAGKVVTNRELAGGG